MNERKIFSIIEDLFNIKNDSDIKPHNDRKFKNHKKLFKYCYVDSHIEVEENYSVKNLMENQIWLSKPQDFNDPFDASLGLSEQFIFDQMMGSILNWEYIDESTSQLNSLNKQSFSTYKGFSKKVEKMDDSLIKDFLSYYAVNVSRYNRLIEKISSGEINELFIEMFMDKEFANKFFANLIRPELRTKSNIEKITKLLDKDGLSNLVEDKKTIPEIALGKKYNLIKPQYLYDMSDAFGLDSKLIDSSIFKIKESIESTSRYISQFINSSYGISCFSETHDHALMWGHYANKHKGFCVEYDMERLTKNDPKSASLLLPVIYSHNRPVLNAQMVKSIDIIDGKVNISENMNQYFTRALVTKSIVWKYEKEWRIISTVANDKALNFNCISAVYAGARASDQLKRFLQAYCKEKGIDFYQYKLDIMKYELILSTDSKVLSKQPYTVK